MFSDLSVAWNSKAKVAGFPALLLLVLLFVGLSNLSAQSLDLDYSVNGGTTWVRNGGTKAPGSLYEYRIRYSLSGTTASFTGVVITDPLPAAVTFDSLVDSPHGTGAYDSVSHSVVYTFADPVASGTTGEVRIKVRFLPGIGGGVTAVNTAQMTAATGIPSPVDSPVTSIMTSGAPASSGVAVSKDAAGSEAAIGGGFYWDIGFRNRGGSDVNSFIWTDTLPKEFVMERWQWAASFDGTTSFTVSYKTTLDPTYRVWPGGPFSTDDLTVHSVAGDLSLLANEYVTELQFDYGTVPSSGFNANAGIRISGDISTVHYDGNPNDVYGSPVNVTAITGDRLVNCVSLSGTDAGDATPYADSACTETSLFPLGTGVVKFAKTFEGDREYVPNEKLRVSLQMVVPEYSGATVSNPTLADLLPPELAYLGNVTVGTDPVSWIVPAPTVTTTANHAGTGRELVRFSWAGSSPAVEAVNDTTPRSLTVSFDVQVVNTAVDGWYDNDGFFYAESPADSNLICDATAIDIYDIDADSDITDIICSSRPSFEVEADGGDMLDVSAAASRASVGSGFYWDIDHGHPNEGAVDNYLVVVDPLPKEFVLEHWEVRDDFDANTQFRAYYKTTVNGAWAEWPGGPFNTDDEGLRHLVTTDLGLPVGVYVSALKFDYATLPGAYGFSKSRDSTIRVWGDISTIHYDGLANDIFGVPLAVGTMSFCPNVSGFNPVSCAMYTDTECRDVDIINVQGVFDLNSRLSGNYFDQEEIFSIEIEMESPPENPTPLTNPTLANLLPEYFTYVGNIVIDAPVDMGVVPLPTVEEIADFNGTGKTLLRFSWAGSSPPVEIIPNTDWKSFKLTFDVQVKPGATTGAYTNYAYGWVEFPTNTFCEDSDTIDSDDIDGDGNTSEELCYHSRTIRVSVPPGASVGLEALLFVKGQNDTIWSQYPAVGSTVRGGVADYQLRISNPGDVTMRDIVVIDILPWIGDRGVVDLSARNTEWTPVLAAPVMVPPGITVYYSESSNPERDDLTPGIPADAEVANWTAIPPSDLTLVKSLKLVFEDAILQPNDEVVIEWPMRVPNTALENKTAWNSTGFTGTRTDNNSKLLASEPLKVGILTQPTFGAELGDFVWNDTDKDGQQDVGEAGINGVTVELYKPLAATPDPATDSLIGFTITNNNGSFLFPNIAAGGDHYLVFYPPTTAYTGSPSDTTTDDLDSDGTFAFVGGAHAYVTAIRDLGTDVKDYGADQGFYIGPTLSVADVTVGESATSVAVTVSLSTVNATDITVDYVTADLTAAAGADYTATAGNLTIVAGTLSANIVIPVLTDSLVEATESFNLNLSNAVGAPIVDSQASVMITDDDATAISINDSTVSEVVGIANLTINLSNPSAFNISVDFATSEGSPPASVGSDYNATSGTATIPAGSLSTTFPVTILDDTIEEALETFNVDLTNPVGVNVGISDSQATIYIADNDGPPLWDFCGSSVQDYALIVVGNNVTFNSVDSGVNGSVGVGPGVTMDLTKGGISGALIVHPPLPASTGSVDTVIGPGGIPVTPIAQDLSALESEVLRFADGASALAPTQVFGLISGTTTINATAPDGRNVILIDEIDFTGTSILTLNGTADDFFVLNVKDSIKLAGQTEFVLSGGLLSSRVFVNLLPGGTELKLGGQGATYGGVFMAVYPGSVISASGGNSTLNGALFGRDVTMSGTIINQGSFGCGADVSVADTTVIEGAGSVSVNVTRAAASALPLEVSFNTSDGTALGGSDFTAQSGTITIPAGATSAAISIALLDDSVFEASESFTVMLTDAGGATIIDNSAVVTIMDNDPVSITVADVPADEAAGTVDVVIALSNPSSFATTVDYATADGSAMAGTDYVATSGTVNIPAGTLLATVTVTLLNDTVLEPDEDFFFDLSNATGATITDSQATVTISDPGKAGSFSDWQTSYAASLGGAVNLTDNPDGDLYDNLLEYALCLHPGTGAPGPGGFFLESNGTGIDVKFFRPVGGLSDVIYEIHGRVGLPVLETETWTVMFTIPGNGAAPPGFTVTDLGNGIEEVSAADIDGLVPVTKESGFIRLTVKSGGVESYAPVWGWAETTIEAGQTETYSNPFTQPELLSGAIDAVTGTHGIDVSVAAGGVPLETLVDPATADYYIEIIEGDHEGHRFDVSSVSGTVVTLAVDTDIYSGQPYHTLVTTVSIPSTLAGDRFILRAHLTLDDLFPPASGAFTPQAHTLVTGHPPDMVNAYGTDWEPYWLYDDPSGSPYWDLDGDAFFINAGDTVIPPAKGLFLTPQETTVTLVALGMVRKNDFAMPLPQGWSLQASAYPLDQGPAEREMSQDTFNGSNDPSTSDTVCFWLGDQAVYNAAFRCAFLFDPMDIQTPRWLYADDVFLTPRDFDTSIFPGDRSGFYYRYLAPKPEYVLPLPWCLDRIGE